MAEILPAPNPDKAPMVADERPDALEIVEILRGYINESETSRSTGPNGRDDVWDQNWDLYWGRQDFTGKAGWQSKQVMPEVPQFVDRWSAALKEALNQPGRFYTVEDPRDEDKNLVPALEKFMDMLLDEVGRSSSGHKVNFCGRFGGLMKLGALSAICSAVTFKKSWDSGYVAVDLQDPRNVWFDHTGRGLYRRRKIEIDKHDLETFGKTQTKNGEPLYNLGEIQRLRAYLDEGLRLNRESASGHGQFGEQSGRVPIIIDEFLCTLVNKDGKVIGENCLVMMANQNFIIRGPEKNPFWHKKDWVIFSPINMVPFSVYGKSYLENWSAIASTFNEMTNLILDGVFTSSMNAFAAVTDMLEEPAELAEGVHPNKVFQLSDGTASVNDFIKEIHLGRFPPEAIAVWQGLKQELREGANLSEIALGQLPPKGDITATEINQSSQSSSAVIRSTAREIETNYLEPLLNMIFQTGLQNFDFKSEKAINRLGREAAAMLGRRKAEFRDRGITFRVSAISSLIERAAKLQSLLAALGVIASNEMLLKEFFNTYNPSKLMELILKLHGVDTSDLTITEAEKQTRDTVAAFNQASEAAKGQSAQGPAAPSSNLGPAVQSGAPLNGEF